MPALNRKQLAFARVMKARVIGGGDPLAAEAYAAGRAASWRDTPEVAALLKAAVDALATGDSGSTLAAERDMAGEFLELVRARSVVGRLADLRRVPLQISIASVTASPSGGFVGENRAAPVTRGAFDRTTLQAFKLQVDTVVTSELLRTATATSDAIFSFELARALAAAEDRQFLDPLYPAVADVRPASITSGLAPTTSAGTSAANILADLEAIFDSFDGADASLDTAVLLLHPKSARSLAKLQGSNGGNLFAAVGARGGEVWGVPVICSSTLEHAGSPGERFAVLVDPRRVLYGEEPVVEIETARHTTLQMDDAATSGASAQVSLWQEGLVALRAQRWVSWATAGTAAAVLTAMAW